VSQASEKNPDFDAYQRELARTDEVIGLRAALAQESVRNSPPRQRVEQLEAEILALRQSTTWRVGRLVMAPVRILRRLSSRGK
jgi:hypothetical protein